MADTSFMARFGARLVTNGYAILPIGLGTKKPARFQRGVWADYPEWNRHTERGTTEVEVSSERSGVIRTVKHIGNDKCCEHANNDQYHHQLNKGEA